MRKLLAIVGLLVVLGGCRTAPKTGHAVYWHLDQGTLRPGMSSIDLMHEAGPPYDRMRHCIGAQHVEEWIYQTDGRPRVSIFLVDGRVDRWQVKTSD